MGRKGDSKRKTSKAKSPVAGNPSTNSVVAAIARVSDAPASRAPGRGDSNSTSKSGKKK